MRRVKAEPEFTLIGGILRFPIMADAIKRQLGCDVNVPAGEMVQFVAALGAALLGQRRLRRLREEGAVAAIPQPAYRPD
jgi:activator of 2-hydroxyglutaryl-CoA dehydratase